MLLFDLVHDLIGRYQFPIIAIKADDLGMVLANAMNLPYELPLIELGDNHEIRFLQFGQQLFIGKRPEGYWLTLKRFLRAIITACLAAMATEP